MRHFQAMIAAIRAANAEFALWFGSILAWPAWLPFILLGSAVGLVFRREDVVMVLLTVQTSVDAAATKMLQNHVRAKDDKRDELMAEQVQALTEMICELKRQNDAITDMMNAATRRDKLAAKRDAMILTALESRGDLYDFVREGVSSIDAARKTARRAGPPRKTHGRANRQRP